MKATEQVLNDALASLKTSLDGGRLYYFAGPVPATAGEALNLATTHTQLVEMTESDDGVTGLTFDAPNDGILAKAAAETWQGLVAFDGFEDAETTLTPTFYRMGEDGDNCRGLTTDARIQGTIGGPASSADIKLTDGNTVTDNGTNKRSLPVFTVDQLTVG